MAAARALAFSTRQVPRCFPVLLDSSVTLLRMQARSERHGCPERSAGDVAGPVTRWILAQNVRHLYFLEIGRIGARKQRDPARTHVSRTLPFERQTPFASSGSAVASMSWAAAMVRGGTLPQAARVAVRSARMRRSRPSTRGFVAALRGIVPELRTAGCRCRVNSGHRSARARGLRKTPVPDAPQGNHITPWVDAARGAVSGGPARDSPRRCPRAHTDVRAAVRARLSSQERCAAPERHGCPRPLQAARTDDRRCGGQNVRSARARLAARPRRNPRARSRIAALKIALHPTC